LIALVAAAALQAVPSDYELWRAARAAPGLRIFHGEARLGEASARRVAERWMEIDPRPVEVARLSGKPPSSPALRVIVGTSGDLAVRHALAGVAALKVEAGTIRTGGRTLGEPTDAVVFFTWVGGEPLLGLLANSDETLASWAGRATFPERPQVRPLRGEVDASYVTKFFGKLRYRYAPGSIPDEMLLAAHACHVRSLERLRELTGSSVEQPIEVVLYSTLEEKESASGDGRASHSSVAERRVHALLSAELSGASGAEVARVAAFGSLGLARAAWLEEGLAATCASAPLHEGSASLAWRLENAGWAGSAADLLDPRARGRRSPLVLRPLEGVLVEALAQGLGPDTFRLVYRGEVALPAPAVLESLLRDRLGPAASQLRESSASRAAGKEGASDGLPLRAFALIPGVPASSERERESLDRLRETGANAVALTAWRTLDPPGSPRRASIDSGRTLAPSDTRLEWLASAARARGLSLVLRSHLASIRDGERIGDLHYMSAERWKEYFACLRQSLLHDALLAERLSCQWLIVGMEMRGTTHPPEAVNLWKGTLMHLRRVFSGRLAYQVSWTPIPQKTHQGEEPPPPLSEIQALEIAPELDAIAVGAYAPLSEGPDPSDEQLEAAARRFADEVEELARRERKPVFLGEVGYSATSKTFLTPWRPNGEPDSYAQFRCYEALNAAFRDRDWLAGAVIHGWPIDVSPGESAVSPFSPLGRPALWAIQELFRGMTH
jgi:glycosyl hydrolase family 113